MRLTNYDYSQPGAYFVTICTKNQIDYFGEIIDDIVHLSPIGHTAHQCWIDIPKHYPNVALDEFIIMPNHIHIIWSENENNRKETAQTSFFKFSAHQFLQKLKSENNHFLSLFQVEKSDRDYQFWQRNILNIEVYSEKVFSQKLEYIHNNPLQDKWQLVNDPVDYKYSSASFYELGIDNFGILTDYYQM